MATKPGHVVAGNAEDLRCGARSPAVAFDAADRLTGATRVDRPAGSG